MSDLHPENSKYFGHEQPEVRRVAVCIVSHNGYGAISGDRGGHVGGVERQTSLLARWLAARGHKVSFLTWHEDGTDEELIDGVRVLKICRKDGGLPGLRFLHPKWSGLITAMRKADADVYYQNCGGCVTGQMAIWCRQHGKPLVFSMASDADCDPALPELRTWRERLLYRHGLRHATRRIAQTATQGQLLADNFGVDSEIIPMPAPDPGASGSASGAGSAGRIVWVGRVCQVKRPDLLLDIAESCPDLCFDVAGPVYDDEYSRAVAKRATTVPNVRMLGVVPREKIPELYRSASLLCCTSDYEGFPNTFLEAWSHGLPIVSTFDPDGLIGSRKLGRIGRNPASLVSGIRALLADLAHYEETSARVRKFFLDHHSMEAVMPRFERIFIKLATGATTRRDSNGIE